MVVKIVIAGFIMVLLCNFPEDSCGINPDDTTGRFHEECYEYCLRQRKPIKWSLPSETIGFFLVLILGKLVEDLFWTWIILVVTSN